MMHTSDTSPARPQDTRNRRANRLRRLLGSSGAVSFRAVVRIAWIAALGACCAVSGSETDAEYLCLYGHPSCVRAVHGAAPFCGSPSGAMFWMNYDCPGTEDVVDVASWDVLLPAESVAAYSRLHVLQSLGHALDAPQGLVAGEIFVRYADGSETTYALIVGVNTAEWACERQDWADCLLHEQIPPANSWMTPDSEGTAFPGHNYYVAFDLDPSKDVMTIGFCLSQAACRPRPQCGDGDLHTWFRVHIAGLALELPD